MLLTPGEPFARLGGDVLHVDRLLHRGHLGELYVVHATDARPGALRVLRPEVAERVAEVFDTECRLAESLRHPHLVRSLDHGVDLGTGEVAWPPLYWSLSELRADTAERLVPAPGERADPSTVLRVLGQVASALDHLHVHGLVHRDVRPRSVLLAGGSPPDAALGRLGAARLRELAGPLARHGRQPDRLGYASPEVLTAARLGPAADVYSLGCLATELLSGLPPFPGRAALNLVRAHLHAAPPAVARRSGGLPLAVDGVLARALAKEPTRRPASAGLLVAELAEALEVPLTQVVPAAARSSDEVASVSGVVLEVGAAPSR